MSTDKVKSINWHITDKCNYSCKFCFSKVLGKEIEDMEAAEQVLHEFMALGVEKINFAGGEPLLYPHIYELIELSKSIGFITSITTNGSLLDEKIINRLKESVDWIGISIDSANECTEKLLGRGSGKHVVGTVDACDLIHSAGIKLKVNTTVTRLNYNEDMIQLIHRLDPNRWKVFQVLHIKGQNDEYIKDLEITKEEFNTFIEINKSIVLSNGQSPVFESNEDMIDSYLMLEPSGNIMGNHGQVKNVIQKKLVDWSNTSNFFNIEKYNQRKALYDWRTGI